jgi:HSP20 family molecular chaperone IbpA
MMSGIPYDEMPRKIEELCGIIEEKNNIINNMISYLYEIWRVYESDENIEYKLKLFGFNEEDIKIIMRGEGIDD